MSLWSKLQLVHKIRITNQGLDTLQDISMIYIKDFTSHGDFTFLELGAVGQFINNCIELLGIFV